jgi:hypothetical protein
MVIVAWHRGLQKMFESATMYYIALKAPQDFFSIFYVEQIPIASSFQRCLWYVMSSNNTQYVMTINNSMDDTQIDLGESHVNATYTTN